MHNDTKIAVLFIIINFCVAYVSDNVLNDLSKYSKIKAFTSLSPYFKKKSIVGAGIYAGLTVVAATIILMILYKVIFNTYLPNTSSHNLFSSTFMVYSIFFIWSAVKFMVGVNVSFVLLNM